MKFLVRVWNSSESHETEGDFLTFARGEALVIWKKRAGHKPIVVGVFEGSHWRHAYVHQGKDLISVASDENVDV